MTAASTQVLIADGDRLRNRRIAEACAARGLACQTAEHGATALELALDEVPRVLVSQLELPLIDGPRLTSILRTNPRTRALEVLFLADRAEDARREDLGGRVLPAAVDPEVVAGCVQATLAGHRVDPDAAAGAEGAVAGELSELALADLLQLFQVSRRTGTLELEQDLGRGRRREGRIALREGDVVAAAAGGVRAEKALFRMLAWDRGRFAFQPAEALDGAEVEMHAPTRALLREGLRQLREWERLAVELPPLGARAGLRIPRSALPSVIHPLTQEVLLALEHGSRVGDVVDRCSFPDYQVLRTLHTLVERGMVELRSEPEAAIPAADTRLFTSSATARLREWLDLDRPGDLAARRAKVLVLAADPALALRFAALLVRLPGAELVHDPSELGAEDLVPLARVGVDEQVGLDIVHCPAEARMAPLWPLVAQGTLASLLLVGSPAGAAAAALRPAARAIAATPGARIFAVALLAPGESASADELAGHLPLAAPDALTLLYDRSPAESDARLRELFARLLP